MPTTMAQGFKANTSTPRGLSARGPRPGLKLSNAFSVIVLINLQRVFKSILFFPVVSNLPLVLK
jgi:hypothetical protein